MKTDFNFLVPIIELLNPPLTGLPEEEPNWKQGQLEDWSLEEVDVPLSSKWIQQQMVEGELPPVGLMEHSDHQ